MICLLLIMTMIFISSTSSAEQKIKHSDTRLEEEDMNAKAKAWLLMVESGKVDQEELRRITPKSIFIAPLLTSRTAKCKEGYRHDHLGQCVKVIKIDPKVQLELLLERLNKLYGEKKEEKEEAAEILEESSGPLHFSLPITNAYEKDDKKNNTKLEFHDSHETLNETTLEVQNVSEFIPVSLPLTSLNQTNQTKEIESSGAGPLNDSESLPENLYQLEGQIASGDDPPEEESTTSSVTLLSEETDYLDLTEPETTSLSETQFTTELPSQELPSTLSSGEIFPEESYQNHNLTLNISNSTTVSIKENINVPKEILVENKSNSDKIYFPNDNFDDLKTQLSSIPQNTRIRFPDEVPQRQVSSYHFLDSPSPKFNHYETHSKAVTPEQFWWLPKNWQIDESQHKSALVKVWSRLPLMHDITNYNKTPEGFKRSAHLEETNPNLFKPEENKQFPIKSNQNQPSAESVVKPFRRTRFQDVLLTPRQNFRYQR